MSNSFFADALYISYLVFRATVRRALSFSSVAILYNSFGRMKRSMSIFTDVYPYACETSLYVQTIRDFLDYEQKIVSEKKLAPDGGAKEIELQNVTFAYNSKDGSWSRARTRS